jgi:hypothetical protein
MAAATQRLLGVLAVFCAAHALFAIGCAKTAQNCRLDAAPGPGEPSPVRCGNENEACVLEFPPGSLPVLRRFAALTAPHLPRSPKPICTEQDRGVELECEAVDDLAAIEGTGVACGPGGVKPRKDCPELGGLVRRVASTQPSDKPCGAAACANIDVLLGEDTRVTFYDDPSCHGGPTETVCAAARHACYYRVFAVRTDAAVARGD